MSREVRKIHRPNEFPAHPTPVRHTLRDVQREATRDRLIAAALEAFTELEYSQARVDDIAARAGASRATFYLHFRSKAELLAVLVQRAEDAFAASYDDLVPALRAGNTAGIAAWITSMLTRWQEVSPLMRPVFEAANTDQRIAARLLPATVPGAAGMAAALLRTGLLSDPAAAEVTASVLLAPLYLVFRSRIAGGPLPQELVVTTIAENWSAHARTLVE